MGQNSNVYIIFYKYGNEDDWLNAMECLGAILKYGLLKLLAPTYTEVKSELLSSLTSTYMAFIELLGVCDFYKITVISNIVVGIIII